MNEFSKDRFGMTKLDWQILRHALRDAVFALFFLWCAVVVIAGLATGY